MHVKSPRKTGGRTIHSQSLVDEYVRKELSRRQMVQGFLLAGAAGLVGACGSTTVVTQPAPGGSTPAPGPDAPEDTPEAPKHLVGMGYDETDRRKALAAALAETVGLSMIKPGDSVYLRVNANSGDPYPYSTSPDSLLAIGGMLRDLGVTDLRIGDRSFWGDTDTAGNLDRNGIAAAAKKLGTTADVYDDQVDWLAIKNTPSWKGTIRLPVPVTSADHILIMSCVKTHFISTITMSLKIALGLVHADDRARDGNLNVHDTKVLYDQVAQINRAFTPSLIIGDGYQAVISGGPTVNDKPPAAPSGFTKGITGDPKVFIVSTDRIAADVTGIAVLQTVSPSYELVKKTKPFANPMIAAAVKAGLGIADASAYDLSGPTVPDLETYRALVTG